jgi:hypothetical protein
VQFELRDTLPTAQQPILTRPSTIVFLAGAAGHFVLSLLIGVFGFLTQGNLTSPDDAPAAHGVLSSVADVLEFPLVWAVRLASPEALTGFTPAAVLNSLLWGSALAAVVVVQRKNRE